MKSITIHALDDQLAARIKSRAQELSISMNELMKRVLAEGLGIKTPITPPYRADFAKFCGTWSDKEGDQFDRNVKDFSRDFRN